MKQIIGMPCYRLTPCVSPQFIINHGEMEVLPVRRRMFVGAQTMAPDQSKFNFPHFTASTTPQEFTMTAIRTLIALSVATLATACASPGAMNAAPASPGMSGMASPMAMSAMEPRMKAMQEMHQKMMAAKTPAERQALMADHMKAMQGGMAMMKGMHSGMQGMAGMGDAKGMSADMAKRHQMMTDHMAMMQMMMDMMADRMPAAPAS